MAFYVKITSMQTILADNFTWKSVCLPFFVKKTLLVNLSRLAAHDSLVFPSHLARLPPLTRSLKFLCWLSYGKISHVGLPWILKIASTSPWCFS